MAGDSARPLSPLWGVPVRLASVVSVALYLACAYRIRRWGQLPARRGPTLVVANHQHDLDDLAVVSHLNLLRSWRDPVYTLSSRRQFEPGFMALRIPWLAPLLQQYNPAALFGVLGMLPIENELTTRALANVAWAVHRIAGDVALSSIFSSAALERLSVNDVRASQVFRGSHFACFQRRARLSEVHEPYRSALIRELRAQVEEDLAHAESLLRRGATMYLTPEGRATTDGRLNRFRGAYTRFAPIADVYLAAVSFDPFLGRRLSMLYRILPLHAGAAVEEALCAARPVTVSQLLAEWLGQRRSPFSAAEACAALSGRLQTLPPTLFVDPLLRRAFERVVRGALATMSRIGVLVPCDRGFTLAERRTHRSFPHVDDMIAYQARFFEQTLRAANHLHAGAQRKAPPA